MKRMKLMLLVLMMLICSSNSAFARVIDSEYFHIEVPSNMVSVGELMGLTPDLGYMLSDKSGNLSLAVVNVPNEKNVSFEEMVQHFVEKQANKFGELKKVDSQSDNETKCVLQSRDFYSLIPPIKTYIVVLMNKEKTHCAVIMLNFTAANVDDAEYIIRTYLEKANIK